MGLNFDCQSPTRDLRFKQFQHTVPGRSYVGFNRTVPPTETLQHPPVADTHTHMYLYTYMHADIHV